MQNHINLLFLEIPITKLKTLRSDFEQVAAMIEANPTTFVLWTFDTEIGISSNLTNLNIVRKQVLSAVTQEMYLQAISWQLPTYLAIAEQEPGKLEKYDSHRLVIDTEISSVTGNEFIYLIKDGNSIWTLT